MSQFTCVYTLPAIPPGEGVTSRRLSRSVNGGGFTADDFGASEVSRKYVVNAGDAVTFRLYHIDAAGNVSPPADDVTASAPTDTDTTPPSKPGAGTVTFTPYTSPPAGRALLSASDFTFLGSFDLQGNVATDLAYGSGLTHRYVGGEFRLMTSSFNSYNANVVEFSPGAFGSTVNDLTNTWAEVFPAGWRGGAVWRSLWWDEVNSRLFTTVALDYPQGGIPIDEERLVSVCTLNGDGSVTPGSQLVRLQGIGQRAVVGGLRKIPQWFRTANGVGPYLAGFGGYCSLMAQGLGPALGPFFAAVPDPSAFTSESEIPAGQIAVLADCRSGSVQADYAPATGDRGIGLGGVVNYYDSGDPRPNPQTPPTDPPAAGARWQSPAPDGKRRWVWGDSYWSTANWIDDDAGTRGKHGLVAVATLATGKAYYMTSTLNCDSRVAEIHVYDPADLAAVKAGTLQPWLVRPKSMLDISLIISQGCDALRARNGNGQEGSIGGATFDAATNTLWLISHWAVNSPPFNARIYAFRVGL